MLRPIHEDLLGPHLADLVNMVQKFPEIALDFLTDPDGNSIGETLLAGFPVVRRRS